jgi:hypothetical protein
MLSTNSQRQRGAEPSGANQRGSCAVSELWLHDCLQAARFFSRMSGAESATARVQKKRPLSQLGERNPTWRGQRRGPFKRRPPHHARENVIASRSWLAVARVIDRTTNS